MQLSGTEAISIELSAVLEAGPTDALAPRVAAPLTLERDAAGRGCLSVLVLEMHGLGVGWALPTFDYREVLYRLGVIVDGVPAWLALRCDLDRVMVRRMAAATIRYPVQRATIAIEQVDGGTVSFRAETDVDSLAAKLRLHASGELPATIPPRRTFVVDRGRVLEVPWDERAAPARDHAAVTDVDNSACRSVYGAPVTFDGTALVHRGRKHFCGRARPVRW
jgi:hypothetical protein